MISRTFVIFVGCAFATLQTSCRRESDSAGTTVPTASSVTASRAESSSRRGQIFVVTGNGPLKMPLCDVRMLEDGAFRLLASELVIEALKQRRELARQIAQLDVDAKLLEEAGREVREQGEKIYARFNEAFRVIGGMGDALVRAERLQVSEFKKIVGPFLEDHREGFRELAAHLESKRLELRDHKLVVKDDFVPQLLSKSPSAIAQTDMEGRFSLAIPKRVWLIATTPNDVPGGKKFMWVKAVDSLVGDESEIILANDSLYKDAEWMAEKLGVQIKGGNERPATVETASEISKFADEKRKSAVQLAIDKQKNLDQLVQATMLNFGSYTK